MTIVASESNISGGRTIWTGRCCQSGFTVPDTNPDFFCTSTVTAPIALLVIPDITTADVYTTLPDVKSIQHDQVTVLWEEQDLSLLPRPVAGFYASLMGLDWAPALTVDIAATNPALTSTTGASLPPSTGQNISPTLPPLTTDVSTSSTPVQTSSSSNTVPTGSPPTNNLSATTFRPPTQSWFPASSSRSTNKELTEAASSSKTSSTFSSFQSTTSGWPPSTLVNSSYARRPKSQRLHGLCLAWMTLFIATYI
ncbi:uncharacterized protein B0I36DRAFT_328767, partial [Microdochium trichocladiopsis]